MKRQSSEPYRGAVKYDIRKDFTPEQLQEIGAVAMAFNALEGALNFIVFSKINMGFKASWTILEKINGISARIEVLRSIARDDLKLGEDLWKDTLDKVNECKRYRDAVVHTQMVDTIINIGETVQKGKINHVLLTQEALSGLYDFISAVHVELAALHYLMETHAELKQTADAKASSQPREQVLKQIEADHQIFLRDRQSRRALKPLPKVPDLVPIPEELRTMLQQRAKRSPRLASKKARR